MKKTLIAGVDEAGRGPWAGPVVACAVIIDYQIPGITDSKKLSASKRSYFKKLIEQHAIAISYGKADAVEIDAINIHNATLLAMKRAIENLSTIPTQVIVDGMFKPEINIPVNAIIKADLNIYSVSAASILAKEARDAEMLIMDKIYPLYGFAKHKGYGTREHSNALKLNGPCDIHRKSFSPINKL